MDKRANKLLLIGMIWLIIIPVVYYFSLVRPGIGTRWEQGPQPPEPVTHVALGESGEMLAFTSNGTIYELGYAIGWPTEWTKVDRPSGNPVIGWSCSIEDSKHIVLPPPGNVKSQISESCVIFESVFHFELALLESGDVWLWVYESYAYTDYILLTSLICGFVMGIPILLMGLIKMVKKSKKTL